MRAHAHDHATDSQVKTPQDVLRSVFGYTRFRSLQEAIIDTVLAGGDAFVLMPTGGGKSLCYQIPAILLPGTAIVVSPLISLMKDQVDALRACGVQAAYYNSTLDPFEAESVVDALRCGELDLLYVAPERLLTERFMALLQEVQPSLVAIDETHCVSMWGHDFRPEYAELRVLREAFPATPVIALTATADPHTRGDILEVLDLGDACQFVASFDRPNIRYLVKEKRHPQAQLLSFIRRHPDESGIVYCLTRRRVAKIADLLRSKGLSADAYHAGLDGRERRRVQEGFLRDDIRIVVATVAFGMGIDKSNVRFVAHFDMPKTVEAYYQETGRAGRDGLPSEALALFGLADVATARALIGRGGNPEQRRIETHKLNAVVAFAAGDSCRRRALLAYFGESLEADCDNCDICLDPPEQYDATVDAQKALSCVYRVGQRFGIQYVIDVLRGSNAERLLKNHHDRISTYGIGADRSRDEWGSVIRQLIHRGYLVQDIADYSTLKLTARARPVLEGGEQLTLAKPRAVTIPTTRARRDAGGVPLTDADASLFAALRRLRREIADARKVPAYVVFSDATLRDMCARAPSDEASMLDVSGVGTVKLQRYGHRFLEIIAKHRAS